jgi:hypothetical protein
MNKKTMSVAGADTDKGLEGGLDLGSFVDDLIEEKGFSGMDSSAKDIMRADLLERLEDRINAVILASLPGEKIEDFEKVLDNGDDRAVQEFCRTAIPDLNEKIAAELLRFRSLYIS